MPTEEIPREQWTPFFESFSRMHEGWLGTVEVLDDQMGCQVEADNLPLQAIATDCNRDGTNTISITMKGHGDTPRKHVISDVMCVRIKRDDRGADDALSLESTAASRTLLMFRSTVLPESVDGDPEIS